MRTLLKCTLKMYPGPLFRFINTPLIANLPQPSGFVLQLQRYFKKFSGLHKGKKA